MNWETEQVEHLVSGNFGYGYYEYWNRAGEEVLDEAASRESAIKIMVQRLEAELSDPLGDNSADMEKCFGEGGGDPGELYHAFVHGALGEVDWRDVAETVIAGAEG